jgi:hypothetical protein
MAKYFILKVTKVTYSPHAPWMVRVPPNLWEVEGHKKFASSLFQVGKS